MDEIVRSEGQLSYRNPEKPNIGVGRAQSHHRAERLSHAEQEHQQPANRDQDHELHDAEIDDRPHDGEGLLARRQEMHQERGHHHVHLDAVETRHVELEFGLQQPAQRDERNNWQCHLGQDVDKHCHKPRPHESGRAYHLVLSRGARDRLRAHAGAIPKPKGASKWRGLRAPARRRVRCEPKHPGC
jgi:hypothetical protein